MAKAPHRELARRQHRVLGHFLAVHAWKEQADCIVLDRSALERFLGLTRFKGARVKWLKQDLCPWFPFPDAIYYSSPGRPLGGLYLSRVDLEPSWPKGILSDQKRIARLNKAGVRTVKFRGSLPLEQEIIGQLVGMASGLIAPASAN